MFEAGKRKTEMSRGEKEKSRVWSARCVRIEFRFLPKRPRRLTTLTLTASCKVRCC
jgi:hypothetical protein